MLDKTAIGVGGSWESVVSREEFESSSTPSPRGSPLKDTSNIQEDQPFITSRHNPNRTFRRESIIASWNNIKKEREQALGKRVVYVKAENYEDYYGRNKVKRCKSDRTTSVTTVPKRVKRAYSVLYRYDPNEEKVVKEYKYQLPRSENERKYQLNRTENEPETPTMQKAYSEPFLRPERTTKKKAKRSFTTLLSIKTKFFNIFSAKS